MTAHDHLHLQHIANVLERWVNGPARNKYCVKQRAEDRERLKIIHEQLKNENTFENKNLLNLNGTPVADTVLLF